MQADPVERHSLPDEVTSSSSTNQQWWKESSRDYFAVRRPEVKMKWTRPVRLPPTNSERCLRSARVYQSRSRLSQPAASAHTVSSA